MVNQDTESALRTREKDLIAELEAKPTHLVHTVMEAIALGTEMGVNGIETVLLEDPDLTLTIKKEVIQAPYIQMVRSDLTKFISRRLAGFEQKSDVDSQTVKEIALASAALGDLSHRKHLIP